MKLVLSIFLLVLLSLCMSSAGMGQNSDFQSLRDGAEKLVKGKNPKWKLITKQERDQQITYQWGLEKADVMVTIFYGASRADAAQKMSYAVSHISVGPDVKLKGLGDEAYLWKSYGSDVGAIKFRKDNVYIDVTGNSMALVKDLAKGLAHLIPDK